MEDKKVLYETIMRTVSKMVVEKLELLFEAGVESTVPAKDVMKVISPFGWKCSRNGEHFKIFKGEHVISFHVKHDKSLTLDIGSLDYVRDGLIADFMKTGNPDAINAVPWSKWKLPDPFIRELKDYDKATGKKIIVDEPAVLNNGQRLALIRAEQAIKKANELYKDLYLQKVDFDDPDSVYIMMDYNNSLYNMCRSESDRRPILKTWADSYKREDGKQYLGKIDLRLWKYKYHRIYSDGTIDKKVSMVLGESLNFYDI